MIINESAKINKAKINCLNNDLIAIKDLKELIVLVKKLLIVRSQHLNNKECSGSLDQLNFLINQIENRKTKCEQENQILKGIIINK